MTTTPVVIDWADDNASVASDQGVVQPLSTEFPTKRYPTSFTGRNLYASSSQHGHMTNAIDGKPLYYKDKYGEVKPAVWGRKETHEVYNRDTIINYLAHPPKMLYVFPSKRSKLIALRDCFGVYITEDELMSAN